MAKISRCEREYYATALEDLETTKRELHGQKHTNKALGEQIGRGMEYVQSLSLASGKMHGQVSNLKEMLEKGTTERESRKEPISGRLMIFRRHSCGISLI